MEHGGKTLSRLAEAVGGRLVPAGAGRALITDVTHDSRRSGPGALYVAVRGEKVDGHDFVGRAAAAGSPAVCVEEAADLEAAQIVVEDTRACLGALAAEVHGHPSHALTVVGVTGTNGKTTVTHYLESIARDAGRRTGLAGTIVTRVGASETASSHTTPEAPDFQRLLAHMRDDRVDLAAVEVSSHALELGRVAATRFAAAAFTNLTRDHLDFHGDMDAYKRAKRKLFDEHEVGVAVVNIDDPTGAEIAADRRGELLTVGRDGAVGRGPLTTVPGGVAFELRAPHRSAEVIAPVAGAFNADNAVLAAACGLAAGLSFDEAASGLHTLRGVPGRFEVVSGDDPLRVVVDYAHTPDGVAEAIKAARATAPNRVIAVLGAGGDRDRGKRRRMGAAASAADLVVVTSDNPRSEDPAAIAEAVAAGARGETATVVEIDRSAAVDLAIGEARDGDSVLVLGRGCEPTQETGDGSAPLDDREIAREALARRRTQSAGSVKP